MSDPSFNVGVVTGYLLAVNAPAAVMDAAGKLRAACEEQAVMTGAAPPDAATLAEQILRASETAPSHSEERFKGKDMIAAPETAQGEANDVTAAGDAAAEAENASVSTGGGIEGKGKYRQRSFKAGGIHAAGY